MSIEQSVENVLSSMRLGGIGAEISSFIVNFATDMAKFFTVMQFMGGVIGFFLLAWAIFDFKALTKANSPNVTGGGVAMKIIFSAAMGTFVNAMKMASMSLFGTADPTSPMSYVDRALSIQAVSPFMAMILAVFSLITLLGWFYGMKSLYLFATVNGKQDQAAHVSQAAYMLFGSVIMVNLGLAIVDFMRSGGVEVQSFGEF